MFRLAAAFASLTTAPVVLMTGCERQVAVENSNIDVVNRRQEQAKKRTSRESVASDEGLTQKEVESVLGTPMRRPKGHEILLPYTRKVLMETWVYERDGQSITLNFTDGKLQGTVPRFGEVLDPKAPLKMDDKTPAGKAGVE